MQRSWDREGLEMFKEWKEWGRRSWVRRAEDFTVSLGGDMICSRFFRRPLLLL